MSVLAESLNQKSHLNCLASHSSDDSDVAFMTGSGGTTWDAVGDTGPDAGDSFSQLPFYTSGVNADFVTVNGAYQPVINMDVSHAFTCMASSSTRSRHTHTGP